MGRFECTVSGCGRAFIRKEHLTRHAQSHAPAAYTCLTCGRGFVRNDVLQNHIARHAEPERISRGRRACDRCHANKTRCNGDSPCSSCKKKGVECKDERGLQGGGSEVAKRKKLHGIRDQFLPHKDVESFDSIGDEEMENPDDREFLPNDFQDVESSSGLYSDNEAVNGGILLPPSAVEMSSEHSMPGVELEQEPIISDALTGPTAPAPDQKEYIPPTRSPYAIMYFKHFHHRWPILHAPTFDERNSPVMLTSSVLMIGHWLEGTSESKTIALAIHERVSRHLFSKLLQHNSYASRNKAWPVNLFEACLLHIVFALYTGKEVIISQMVVILGVLVSLLREVGFFAPDTLVELSWPGVFIAFRWVKREARKRLAASIFKVDAYYSILRNKPPLVNSDEMMYSLPSTFALWNSGGFPTWKARKAVEPEEREKNTVRYLLSKAYINAEPEDQIQKLLPEDVQLGLCSTQGSNWLRSESSLVGEGNMDYIPLPPKEETQAWLDFWKTRLDPISVPELPELGTGTITLPECFYHGLEDHTFPCWQKIVAARSSCIIAESRALYHLLNIQLHANTHMLRLSIQDNGKSKDTLQIHTGLLGRVIALKSWGQSRDARKALWHAMWILVHENNNEFEKREAWDPIVHVAASVAAMAVWVYATYTCNDTISHQCVAEISGDLGVDPTHIRYRPGETAELTLLKGDQLDEWLEKGGPVAIGGILVCQCTTTILMATLNAHLPPDGNQGWTWD